MQKNIKYLMLLVFIIIAIVVIVSYNPKKPENNTLSEEKINNEVFEKPNKIVYLVNNSERYTLTKKDDNFNKIMDELNNTVLGNFINDKDGYLLFWDPIDIEKEVYSNAAVLRLIYSENNEINIIFGEDKELDIMYSENGITNFYGGLDKPKKEALKTWLNSI